MHDSTSRIITLEDAVRHLEDALALMQAGSWEYEPETRKMWCSHRTCQILEIDPETAHDLYAEVLSRIHPEDVFSIEQESRRARTNGNSYEYAHRLLMPDGRIKYVREHGRTYYGSSGKAIRFFGIIQDITDRVERENSAREAAESLRQSEQLLRQAVDVARLGFFVYNEKTDTSSFSSRLREIVGWEPGEDLTFEQFREMSHPEDSPRLALADKRARDPDGNGQWNEAFRIVRRDGSIRWLNTQAQVVFERDGASRRTVHLMGTVSDVTELREVTAAAWLKEAAMDGSVNAMAIATMDGRIVYANAAHARLWGYESAGMLLGLSPFELTRHERTEEALKDLREQGYFQGEIEARRSDGSTFPTFMSASVIKEPDGDTHYIIVSFVDLSEQKRLYDLFLQAQKMESVGRLASGVAHDFNNLLTVIGGHAELALDAVPKGSEVHEDIERIIDGVKSATRLTQQLLSFSRKKVTRPELIDLRLEAVRMESLLRPVLGSSVRLEVKCGEDAGSISFDRVQFEQIMLNLAVNARDAMPEGGTLLVKVSSEYLGDRSVPDSTGATSGWCARIDVSDTGTGMSEETMDQIFEPFFTTKDVDQGTGLGLPMVYGVINQNGGRVDVRSELGSGTTFTIHIPRVA